MIFPCGDAAAHVSVISMNSITMAVEKYRTYGIVERDGEITKEGCMPTTTEGLRYILNRIVYATVMVWTPLTNLSLN